MSPRIKVIRKVLNPPIIKGFKPYGSLSDKQNLLPINLLYEEYEALRLCDYDLCNHHQASVMMGVSRPTFTRIYASARQKIAKALVEGTQISIDGGKVYFDSDWYQCNDCNCYFNNPEKEKKVENCPLCNSKKFKNYESIGNNNILFEGEDVCICYHCGYEQKHQYGKPCKDEVCPKCNTTLKRKGKIKI